LELKYKSATWSDVMNVEKHWLKKLIMASFGMTEL